MKRSRQLKWYYANRDKKQINKRAYSAKRHLMLIGKYAISRGLLTTEQFKNLNKFIFENKPKRT